MKKTSKKTNSVKDKNTLNITKETICENCGGKISGRGHFVTSDEKNYIRLCDKCNDEVKKSLDVATKNANYLLAIIYGIIAGVIGAIIWFLFVIITKYELGLIAIGVGWIVAFGVNLGAGKKRTKTLQIISVILALISILAGEYLITNHYAKQYLISEGYVVNSYLYDPIAIMGIIFSSLKESPITILFWGIAVWVAYAVSKPVKIKVI